MVLDVVRGPAREKLCRLRSFAVEIIAKSVSLADLDLPSATGVTG